jgi:hypothetical protein
VAVSPATGDGDLGENGEAVDGRGGEPDFRTT